MIPAFHVGYKEENLKFIKDNLLQETNEQGRWLGSCMYFWDNEADASYWTRQKVKKSGNININKLAVTLCFKDEEYLDLMNDDINKEYEKLWPLVAKKFKVPLDSDPGYKLNLMYKLPLIKDRLSVIRVLGNYPNKDDIFYGKIDKSSAYVNNGVGKIIYGIRKSSVIKNASIVE